MPSIDELEAYAHENHVPIMMKTRQLVARFFGSPHEGVFFLSSFSFYW